MTSDYHYVTHVLFQLRWEAIDDRDGYFMGCYDDPASSDYVSDDAKYGTELTVCDCGTQTPKAWVAAEAAQEPKEAEPQRAPKRKVTLGTCPHSNPLVMRLPGRDLRRY